MSFLLDHLSSFSYFDYTILSVNVLMFLFAKTIVGGFKREGKNTDSAKLYAFRAINLILISLYVAALFIGDWIKPISLTGLTFLLAFLSSRLSHILILKRFGREKEIDGTLYRSDSYQSEVFSLMVTFITLIASFLILINIWGMDDWLRATSVLGILAILVFSTKDVWVPDNINGLILLYNGDLEPGVIVKIPEQNILAIVLKISLTSTTFRDLKTRHHIVLTNSTVRNSKIELLNKDPDSGMTDFAYFKIGYSTTTQTVDAFLEKVWENCCEQSSALRSDRRPEISIVEAGDHAVHWRLGYRLQNAYKMLEVQCLMQRIAFELSAEHGVSLDTPLTHSVNSA